ncbi:MAG: pyrroloquinoline quinone biosynthesis peptide chaperone PqqD [Motiliproteus sp.]|nr:pyrroloquinoline quinone biosynthesis peptide chaperone PqqD [Motiliproteus sp.]MCW9054115.1 pyrroloquinoline quinone biosynthesis peptide chaperone PqqD [Motiliproteus sp.]
MINADSVPAINRHFRLQWEPAQDAHVLLYPEGMVKLNGSAAEVLQLCDGEADVATIIAKLQQKFPEAEGIDADVMAFLEDAHGQQWIQFPG